MSHETTIVGISEGKVIRNEGELISYALGSCVGICLYDRERRIAGMAHILLPCRALAGDKRNPYKFADSGLDELVRAMVQAGAQRNALCAKIAGGASMFREAVGKEPVGAKNVAAVHKALKKQGIWIAAQDVGADYGRTIRFSARTGALHIKAVRAGERMI